ncbi:MAG: hypothetical protein WKF55_04560 [Gemmatimonadaceae bacterium]
MSGYIEQWFLHSCVENAFRQFPAATADPRKRVEQRYLVSLDAFDCCVHALRRSRNFYLVELAEFPDGHELVEAGDWVSNALFVSWEKISCHHEANSTNEDGNALSSHSKPETTNRPDRHNNAEEGEYYPGVKDRGNQYVSDRNP